MVGVVSAYKAMHLLAQELLCCPPGCQLTATVGEAAGHQPGAASACNGCKLPFSGCEHALALPAINQTLD